MRSDTSTVSYNKQKPSDCMRLNHVASFSCPRDSLSALTMSSYCTHVTSQTDGLLSHLALRLLVDHLPLLLRNDVTTDCQLRKKSTTASLLDISPKLSPSWASSGRFSLQKCRYADRGRLVVVLMDLSREMAAFLELFLLLFSAAFLVAELPFRGELAVLDALPAFFMVELLLQRKLSRRGRGPHAPVLLRRLLVLELLQSSHLHVRRLVLCHETRHAPAGWKRKTFREFVPHARELLGNLPELKSLLLELLLLSAFQRRLPVNLRSCAISWRDSLTCRPWLVPSESSEREPTSQRRHAEDSQRTAGDNSLRLPRAGVGGADGGGEDLLLRRCLSFLWTLELDRLDRLLQRAVLFVTRQLPRNDQVATWRVAEVLGERSVNGAALDVGAEPSLHHRHSLLLMLSRRYQLPPLPPPSPPIPRQARRARALNGGKRQLR
eukprot:754426-Hanusia_phi.AAC.2